MSCSKEYVRKYKYVSKYKYVEQLHSCVSINQRTYTVYMHVKNKGDKVLIQK